MLISANNIGKKFGREWVFRKLNHQFTTGEPTAIVGPNGSGKSTLLQILSSHHLASEGDVSYQHSDQTEIKPEDFYQFIDISAPYLELIEEFTLNEMVDFHFKFKSFKKGVDLKEFKNLIFLEKEGNKQIKSFSSGMKQRLKLGLCFFSNSEVCLLDEPTSNLDSRGIDWYQEQVSKITKEKLLIISSNQSYEYEFCQSVLEIPKFK